MTSHDLLLKWSRDRDELAFRELVARHAPMVFATAKRILRNESEAEDVTQDCFETLATTRRLPDNNLGPWLHRVATNRCLDRLRATGRRAQRETAYASRQSPTTDADWDDIYDLVDEAIADLPEKWRTIVVAHFLEGRSQADIANELHLTRQAVHERLGNGIEGIRAHLKRRGIEISTATLTTLLVQHTASAAVPAALTAALGKLALGTHAVAGQSALSWLTGSGTVKVFLAAAIGVAVVASVFVVRSIDMPPDSEPGAASPEASPTIALTNEPTSNETASAAPGSRWPLERSAMPPPEVIPAKLAESDADVTPARASVSGIVLRADGRIFPHAKVWFLLASGSSGGGRTDAAADGGFMMKDLDAGDYSVCVSPPGVEMVSSRAEVAKLTLKPNEQRNDFRIYVGKGTLKIEGTVTDTAGKPIKGVRIETFGQYAAYSSAVTDELGRYALESIPEGTYVIEAEGDYMSDFSESARFARNTIHAETGDTDADIVLERRINLEGRVLRADTRAPIPDFRVSFMNGHAQEFRESLMGNDKETSDTQGRFRLEGAMPGDVTVSAMADGFSPAFIHAHGNDGATISDLEILLSPGRTLTGMVVDTNGQPIAGATLYNGQVASPVFLERAPVAARTDDSGTFSIADAPPTRSFLAAYREGYAPAAARIGAGPVNIVLQRPASLKVTATAPEGLLTDARVMIFYGRHANASYIDGAQFNDEGLAVKDGLIPGPVMLRINRRHDTDKSYIERNAMLYPGKETEVHVDFAPITASLNGIVTWRGIPAADTNLFLQVETSMGIELYKTITGNDGSYSFIDLPAGNASMRVEYLEDPRTIMRNVVTGLVLTPDDLTTYNISLLGASTISGHVSGITPPDAVSLTVIHGTHTLDELTDENSPGYAGLFGWLTGSSGDAEGNYSIADLEPGEYSVLAIVLPRGDWSARQIFAIKHVTVTANQTAVVDFEYR